MTGLYSRGEERVDSCRRVEALAGLQIQAADRAGKASTS